MLKFTIAEPLGLVHVKGCSLVFTYDAKYCQDAKKYIELSDILNTARKLLKTSIMPDFVSAARSFKILPDLPDLAVKLPTWQHC